MSSHQETMTPLEQFADAIKVGDCVRIRELVAAGVDPNAKMPSGFPIMRYATDERVVKTLVELRADINLRGRDDETWVNSAAFGDLDEVRIVLRCGADPNVPDVNGETALFGAQHAGRADIVAVLLEYGANPDVQRNDGWTVLHGAITGGEYDVAKLLVESGANLELAEEKGQTPLYFATDLHGDWPGDFVGLLLRYGANVNTSSKDGVRPIHWAAMRGCCDLVPLFVSRGADINAKTGWGSTPLDLAISREEFQVAKVLTEHGAKTGETLKRT
jgi:ankyrin repeat protein